MPRILVIDDTPLFREPMAASLRSAGFDTDSAGDGKEGLSRARKHVPDLILLDLAMPGMDGLQVARICRADPILKDVPILLLSGVADRESVLQAARLGINDFLLKTQITMSDVLKRLHKHIGQSMPPVKAVATAAQQEKLPILLTREQCMARIENATSTRPMSGVVGQVLSMAGSPMAEMSELATLIGRDPVLSARVLRAANSAAFAGAKKVVTTIQEAVRNVGLSTLRNIATALSVFEAMPAGGADGFHHMRGWQHSFAAALICQHLANVSKTVESGAAYLGGLCHDLGQILFRGEFGKEYSEVLEMQARTARPLEYLERHMLGATQLDLARVILKKMGLPESIRLPIEEFHTLQLHPSRKPTMELTRLLRLADIYANGLLMAALPTSEVGPLAKSECKAALGCDDPPRPDSESMRGQILALTPLLARLPEEEERKLSQPLLANTGKRVWLVRDQGLSAFDPIETSLSGLADVKVSAEFPSPEEMREYDAIVVTGRQRYPLPASGTKPVLRIVLDDLPPKEDEPGIGTVITECGPTIPLERLAAFLSPPPKVMRKAA